MRLDAMAATWKEQASAFDERFGMLVDAEWLHRENKRLPAALRDAKLRLTSACVEDIDYPLHRELDRAQIRQLASCRWVVEHQNVLVTGATETGKTYVACALAQHSCRKRFHNYINGSTHADAICDRLIHGAHRLVLKGPSRRNPTEAPRRGHALGALRGMTYDASNAARVLQDSEIRFHPMNQALIAKRVG